MKSTSRLASGDSMARLLMSVGHRSGAGVSATVTPMPAVTRDFRYLLKGLPGRHPHITPLSADEAMGWPALRGRRRAPAMRLPEWIVRLGQAAPRVASGQSTVGGWPDRDIRRSVASPGRCGRWVCGEETIVECGDSCCRRDQVAKRSGPFPIELERSSKRSMRSVGRRYPPDPNRKQSR